MEIRSGRPLGDAEEQPDLTVPEAFDVVQQDHRALTGRQLCQRGTQPRTQVSGLARIAELRREALRQLVGISDFAPTRNVQCRVGYYTVQPCAKRLVRPESVQRAIRVQKSLLHCIFGVFVR